MTHQERREWREIAWLCAQELVDWGSMLERELCESCCCPMPLGRDDHECRMAEYREYLGEYAS